MWVNFWSGTQEFGLEQNILGPVKGQGIRLKISWKSSEKLQAKIIWLLKHALSENTAIYLCRLENSCKVR